MKRISKGDRIRVDRRFCKLLKLHEYQDALEQGIVTYVQREWICNRAKQIFQFPVVSYFPKRVNPVFHRTFICSNYVDFRDAFITVLPFKPTQLNKWLAVALQ